MNKYQVYLRYENKSYFGKPKSYNECETELALYKDNIEKEILFVE